MMPINKSLWTSSYCILMAGLASICLSVIYYIVDVHGGWLATLDYKKYYLKSTSCTS